MVELASRFCYRSWNKGRSHAEYLKNIIEQGHGSVLEQVDINIAFAGISRTLSHEFIRHRPNSPAQESQRFVDYTVWPAHFVLPPALVDIWDDPAEEELRELTLDSFRNDLKTYFKVQSLLEERLKHRLSGTLLQKSVNEASRAFLPNATETRLVMKFNLRSLRHFLVLRGSQHADREIRRLAVATFRKVMDEVDYATSLFDFKEQLDEHGVPYLTSEFGSI